MSSGGGGYYNYRCDCATKGRHSCDNWVHENGAMCSSCQVSNFGPDPSLRVWLTRGIGPRLWLKIEPLGYFSVCS
jgi:hypothetical protein